MHSLSFEAIGTHWKIDLNSKSFEAKIKNDIEKIIQGFDKNYSRFRNDSLVARIASKKGVYEAPQDFLKLSNIYETLYEVTGGLFTPLIGNALSEAGYDTNYSLKEKHINPVINFESSVRFGNNQIEVLIPAILDFGAAGKGYLVDIISDYLVGRGILSHVIDAGGDILQKSSKNVPLRVGLEHPEDPRKAIGTCEIVNSSICASSGNRRKWGRFHHIINPKTLKSPEDVIATWVIGKDTLEADALATALMLCPKPQIYKDFKFEYVILYKDYRAQISSAFPGEIFTR